MTIQLSFLRERLIGSDSLVLGGAKLYTYTSGTTTPATTYSTPTFTPGTELSNPVVADSGGLLPQIFFPTGTYTLTLTTSTGVAVWSQDNVAVDNGSAITFDNTTIQTVSSTTGVYAIPNAQTGTSYTILTTDRGKLVTFTNSSAISVTLPAAGSSFPNGWFVDLENRGVGLATVSASSNIDGQASIVLAQGQGVRVFSDGATYYSQRGKAQAIYASTGGTLTIATGAVTALSFSQYLIDTEGAAASDDLDTISNGIDGKIIFLRTVADARDVVVKHNTGNIYNPLQTDITLAKTQDVVQLRYDAALTKWVVVSPNMLMPTAKYTYTVASGTDGGGSTANAWTTRAINTEDYDDIGITLSSNQMTIPAGTYLISGFGQCTNAGTAMSARHRFQNITAGSTIAVSDSAYAGNTSIMLIPTILPAKITFTTSTVVEMQYYVTQAVATNGLGKASTIASTSEVYAQIFITKIA
jgi:hypothetical protein